MAGTLPVALARRGHQCVVVLPLYACCRRARSRLEPTDLTFSVPVGQRQVSGRLWRSTLPGSSVSVFLVEQPDYFGRDHKSRLQEALQSLGRPLPTYRVAGEAGPEHRKLFHVEVTVAGEVIAQGTGRTKKDAEQDAAKAALDTLPRDETAE